MRINLEYVCSLVGKSSLKQKQQELELKMDQVDMGQTVVEYQEKRDIFVLCEYCKIIITWFRHLYRYSSHYYDLDVEEVNSRCTLKYTKNYVMCVCKSSLGIMLNEDTILLRRDKIIIDHVNHVL